ncbi:hypothetical protein ILUMI_14522 [Ignelater luminosus]|uniref:Alcohol dehydrogenase n=1 Tax=Ignelater luminosus TaxID=2038154 RepID=A0A8K0CU28_IGNLU|nr:hypothetical protein ILUMI_14522 [Ignelater luminosus]
MDAVQFSLKENKLELAKISIPTISNPHHVLVKVAYAGVCGTDLHIIDGEFPCNTNRPFTLGHEFCGTIVDIGAEVKSFSKGDQVAINPSNGCNTCYFCHIGSYNYCKNGGLNSTIGIIRDGGWANYVLVPDEQVHKIPESVTMEQAVLSEPISCLVRGWDLINPIAIGQKILIIGAGIIGNLFAALLHLQGHKKVAISEPNVKRSKLLHINTGYECVTPDELKERQQKDSNYLFDVVMDCSGHPAAIEQGFSLLNCGGKLCLFGLPNPNHKIKLQFNLVFFSISPFDIIVKEARIFGVNINPFTFPKALRLIEAMGDRYENSK